MKAELDRLGYAIFERTLDSRDTGTIENRKRYWFLGISKGLAKGFSYEIDHLVTEHGNIRIQDILEGKIPESSWSDHQYLKDKALRDYRSGKGFSSRQLLTGSERHCGTIGRYYNKRRSTEPFLTREDGKERLFTPAEHARVKNIPEALVKGVSATTAHEVLGQSIDFLQAYLSMKCLMDFFNGKSLNPSLKRPKSEHFEPQKTVSKLQVEQLALF